MSIVKKKIFYGLLAVGIIFMYASACNLDVGSKKGGARTGAKISADAYWQPSGETIVVTVTMRNIGNESATGIKFSVSSPGSLFPSSLKYGTLNPGKSTSPHIQLKWKPRRAGTIKVKITGDNFPSVTATTEYKPLR